jgi:quercetin dioxygenase-like cupin family protein
MSKLFLAVLLGGVALFGMSARAAAPAKATDAAVLTPVDQLVWTDVPEAPGVKLAAVEGDPAKGASHIFMKFPAGFSAPLHHHTAKHFVTVVSGTLVLTVAGKDNKLPPGSFVAFPSKTPHATKCDAGAECVLSIDVRDPWDIVPEGKPTAKK